MISMFRKMLGNKSQRDIREITPQVDKALVIYEEIKKLGNDELRGKTIEFKNG